MNITDQTQDFWSPEDDVLVGETETRQVDNIILGSDKNNKVLEVEYMP
jgi:hypothetical protein